MYTMIIVTLIIIIISSLFIFLEKSEEKIRRCKKLERVMEILDSKIEAIAFRHEYKTADGMRYFNYRPEETDTLMDAINKIEYLTGVIKHLTGLIDAQEFLLKRLNSQNDQWINVKDKTPNPNENLPLLLFDGNFCYISTSCRDLSPDVTYWMPLPEPPRY